MIRSIWTQLSIPVRGIALGILIAAAAQAAACGAS